MRLFSRRSTPPREGIVKDQVGDVLVEYVLLFGVVALPLIPALIAAGVAVVQNFESTRNLVLLPMP